MVFLQKRNWVVGLICFILWDFFVLNVYFANVSLSHFVVMDSFVNFVLESKESVQLKWMTNDYRGDREWKLFTRQVNKLGGIGWTLRR